MFLVKGDFPSTFTQMTDLIGSKVTLMYFSLSHFAHFGKLNGRSSRRSSRKEQESVQEEKEEEEQEQE